MALARDVPFADYASAEVTVAAAGETFTRQSSIHTAEQQAENRASLHRSNRAGALLTYNSRARADTTPTSHKKKRVLSCYFPCYEAFVFVLRQLSADGHSKIYMLSYPPPFPAAAPLRVRAGGCWAPREVVVATYTQR